MTYAQPATIQDVQNQTDGRGISIDKVGVNNFRCPIIVLDREQQQQNTIGRFSLSVNLPHHFKGTHMSRFIEVLNAHRGEITMRTLPAVLADLKTLLDAESAHVDVTFPYFVVRSAPVTKSEALMDYSCRFVGESNGLSEDFMFSVQVPVTTLCPCSKEISDYGAHNQRGTIEMQVRSVSDDQGDPQLIWIEELIEVAEASASAPVYPLLKRPDERHVTMQAYDNPVFVEDVVRNVAARLQADDRVAWFRVHAVNEESIHNHSAFAEVSWTRDGGEV